jgi:hypothetical protein
VHAVGHNGRDFALSVWFRFVQDVGVLTRQVLCSRNTNLGNNA